MTVLYLGKGKKMVTNKRADTSCAAYSDQLFKKIA